MKINLEDTWLEQTFYFLEECLDFYHTELEYTEAESREEAVLKDKVKDLKKLMAYLNKTN